MTPPRVVVVGLGPAGPDLTTTGAVDRIASLRDIRLRTHRHPAAQPFDGFASYDDIYESAATFDEVYARIVADLVALADEHGEVGYVVPGSPHVLERVVATLRDDARVEVEIVPGMSFLELAWGRIGVDPVEAGVTLVDGHRFAVDAAGATGPLLVAHCHAKHVLSDIKLAYEDDEPASAIVLRRLGLPDEEVAEVAWADLDRTVEPDHLTSIFVPTVQAPVAQELIRFQGLVRTLREQCPWDREQTHSSLRPYAVEETYEVIEAIDHYDVDTGDGADHLEEELGDLLYQVFFHAAIAAESGAFTLADVARNIHDKLHRRHPHVFGDAAADSLESDWEAIKQAEKGRESIMDGIPRSLPGLLYANKVLSRAERSGHPVEMPPDTPADHEGDVGSALLALVARARRSGVDAEAAVRRAADRVGDRVRADEQGRPDDL